MNNSSLKTKKKKREKMPKTGRQWIYILSVKNISRNINANPV